MLTRNFSSRPGLLGLGLLLFVAWALTACIGGGNITAEEVVSQSFGTGAAPRVIVETFNGRIEVAGGVDGVQVSVTKRGAGFSQSEAEADLKNVEVMVTQEGDTIRVAARRSDGPLVVGNSGASIRLSVPAQASLELQTSNGAIRIDGVAGDLSLDTSNGKVEVRGGRGRLNLSTSNGSIDIEAEQAVVDAHTSNGQITFGGTLAEGRQVFDTSNGRIDITLPGEAQFSFEASTSNGRVSCEFPMSHTSASSDNALSGVVGENPATSIVASSSNGRIDIRRGR